MNFSKTNEGEKKKNIHSIKNKNKNKKINNKKKEKKDALSCIICFFARYDGWMKVIVVYNQCIT